MDKEYKSCTAFTCTRAPVLTLWTILSCGPSQSGNTERDQTLGRTLPTLPGLSSRSKLRLRHRSAKVFTFIIEMNAL